SLTSQFTRPKSRARSADMVSPIITNSMASLGPSTFGRIVAASGGNAPNLISGCAKRARGVAITRSPRAASSDPPPNAGPFTTTKSALRSLHNAAKAATKSLQKSNPPPLLILADLDSAAKTLSRRIEHDQFYVVPFRQ